MVIPILNISVLYRTVFLTFSVLQMTSAVYFTMRGGEAILSGFIRNFDDFIGVRNYVWPDTGLYLEFKFNSIFYFYYSKGDMLMIDLWCSIQTHIAKVGLLEYFI